MRLISENPLVHFPALFGFICVCVNLFLSFLFVFEWVWEAFSLSVFVKMYNQEVTALTFSECQTFPMIHSSISTGHL